MLESFVDYLRASLTGLGQATHTLGDEIDLVDAYMRIIKMRMEDRLHYAIDVPADLRSRPLPALSLQPLVENAIVHGIAPRTETGTVHIECARLASPDGLLLRVRDDGAGCTWPPVAAKAGGVGLGALSRRFALDYGGKARFSVRSAPGEGFCVEIVLPANDSDS
jgi:sensor histidine kinase YesM